MISNNVYHRLAVSQPVTIPVRLINGLIPMDAANPVWESVPSAVAPLSGQTITTPMHPSISVKTVMVKMTTNGKEIGIWANWEDQPLNNTTIGRGKTFMIKWPCNSPPKPSAPHRSSV
ncbi:MAG: hypothetical protein AB7T38_11100 [Nitrospirales bacterium]